MENENLDKIWHKQDKNLSTDAKDIITKAKKQRKSQVLSITIMAITVAILIVYTIYILPNQWNNFTLGLLLMIGSLVFRILLEVISIYKKESKLVSMDNNSYRSYLEKYYKSRLIINYIITPVCITAYICGFYLLLPYFKKEFSEGFYNYILISGVVSLLIIVAIIINSIIKEQRFLKKLKRI